MLPGIAVVTRKTRLQGLLARHVTPRQVKFHLAAARRQERVRQGKEAFAQAVRPASGLGTKTAAAPQQVAPEDMDYAEYEDEDQDYQVAINLLERELDFGLPLKFVDREFVPNFEFGTCELVVVVGQDGLVANTAKYVGDLPIVAVNPDPVRFDGVLLPFQVAQVRRAVSRVLEKKANFRPVTLAEVELNDSQRLLAFNDFFIGAASHVSARYTLRLDDQEEPQSSSGVLVSTGAGSTGWFSSVFNMAQGLAAWMGEDPPPRINLTWEDRRLLWAVREPFVSKHSQANLVAGLLEEGRELAIESLMPTGGVIFSDGVEADYLQFNSGTIARVRAARQRANLVVE